MRRVLSLGSLVVAFPLWAAAPAFSADPVKPDAAKPADAKPAAKVGFKKHKLDDKFRAEGVAVADFNGDGKLDIAAGGVWFAAPDWKLHEIIAKPKTYDVKAYSDCFNAFAGDFNGDGLPDVLQVVWPGKEAVIFENPGKTAGPWKKIVAAPIVSNESPQFADIDGKGQKALICGVAEKNPDGPDRRMAIVRPGKTPADKWVISPISVPSAPGTQRFAHGLGTGDINGDGRKDVLTPGGWWEQPAEAAAEWKFHKADFGGSVADMVVYDCDGDGDADVIASSAHAFGIWWYEQLPDGKWKTHEIDKSVSQTHALILADINGDGVMDFVTGKRWYAHAAGDPGVNDPAIFCWWELKRTDKGPQWTRHQFDDDSGPGTQFQVIDVNGDGLLDIVTSNKKGTHYFEQVRE